MNLHAAYETALSLSKALAKAEAEAKAKAASFDKADTVSNYIAEARQKRMWDIKRTAGVLAMQLRRHLDVLDGKS